MHHKTMEDNLFPVAQIDTVQYMYIYIINQNKMYDTLLQQTTNDDDNSNNNINNLWLGKPCVMHIK